MIVYDKTGQTILATIHTDCIEAFVEEERNGLFELRFIFPATNENFNHLAKENIVKCDASDTLKDQKFRIYNTRKAMNNMIEVYARHISFDLAYDFVEAINIENQSCEYALNTIFRNSQFSRHYRAISNIIEAQDFNISRVNPLEAIAGAKGSIVDTYGKGAEILRDNETISVLNARGHDNDIVIAYSKNLKDISIEEDTTDLITRIIPVANKRTENGDILIKGNEVDSPYINNYSHPYIKEIDFTNKFKENEEVTIEKLTRFAQYYFRDNKCDIAKCNYKIDFIALSKCIGFEGGTENIGLCDKVTIQDTRYNVDTQSKVIKIVYNVLKNRIEELILGEPKTSLGDVIGGGGQQGEPGRPGQDGKPGADGNIGDFPDSLPAIPVISAKVLGFASVDLSWTFENKVYYSYEVYASKKENFIPNTFDLIFEGQASSFLHQVKPDETWYYRACAVNSHGNRTAFSSQIKVETRKLDNFEEYFSSLAVDKLVAAMFTVDYMEAGIIQGNWINAKNLSVTDGNGKRTFDIDSFGNVNLDVNKLIIRNKNIYDSVDSNEKKIKLVEQKTTDEAITSVVKETLNVTGVENLLEVGNFSKNKELARAFWLIYPNTNWYENASGIGIYAENGEEGYIGSNYIDVANIKGRKVSLAANIMAEDNTNGADIYLIGCRDKTVGGYDWTLRVADISPNYQWTKVNAPNITIPNDINHIWVRIDNDGRKNANSDRSVVVFVDYINLVVGENVINAPIAENGGLKKLQSEYSTFKEQTSSSFTQQAKSIKDVNSSLTEFKQDTNSFIFKSERKGTANLIRSANGKKGYHSGKWEVRRWNTNLMPIRNYISPSESSWAYPDQNVNTFELKIEDGWGMWGGDLGIIQHDIPIVQGETYTVSAYVAGHRHNDCYLYVRHSPQNSYDVIASVAFTPPTGGTDKNNWSLVHTTFVAPTNKCHIEFGMRNSGAEDPYLWFAKPMLNKGSLAADFTDSLNEVHTGITKIDGDGVRCDFEDGTYASMGRNGLRYYKNGMDKPYQYITFNAKISNIRNGYWSQVQLPAFFREKQINHDFQLFVTLGNYNLNAHVAGSINGALRVAFAEWTNWNANDAVIQVRPCFQKIGLDTGKLYGWDSASTSAGATPNEGEGDVIIFAQM